MVKVTYSKTVLNKKRIHEREKAYEMATGNMKSLPGENELTRRKW